MSYYLPGEYLFTHIPKTGGTSIRNWIGTEDSWYLMQPHSSAHEVRGYMVSHGMERQWDEVFKFAFVRNPYDWVESLRRFAEVTLDHPLHEAASWDPSEFVEHAFGWDRYKPMPEGGMIPQTEMFTSGFQIYRFEKYDEACRDLSRQLQIEGAPLHENYNPEPAIPVEGAYREAIADLLTYDFHKLGYPK